jgi:hypothetical protein
VPHGQLDTYTYRCGSGRPGQTVAKPKASPQAPDAAAPLFPNGSEWVRADFHLHTRADKEFAYAGGETEFVSDYVDRLKQQNIRLGVITNHNKFNADEFKALRKRARKEGIGLLPGVELSVNDGANGVHTLVVFSEEWLADGQDYINQFLNVAFAGKVPAQYEQENGRTNDDLINTLKQLESYHRDFFVVFAHVEAERALERAAGRAHGRARPATAGPEICPRLPEGADARQARRQMPRPGAEMVGRRLSRRSRGQRPQEA